MLLVLVPYYTHRRIFVNELEVFYGKDRCPPGGLYVQQIAKDTPGADGDSFRLWQ
jgi:hypothetical protein